MCLFFQAVNRKRRIKLVVDREYESSSTGEESVSESQRSRLPAAANSHANVNGSVYVAQNGSIMRTRRSANAAAPSQTHPASSNNNLKFPSPVFSSRLAKHFKKLDKLAATLEERVPLNSPRAEGGCNTLRTFQSSRATSSSSSSATAPAASSFTHMDNSKTPNGGDGGRQSSISLGSSSSGGGCEAAAAKFKLQPAAAVAAMAGRTTTQRGEVAQSGEKESRVDGEDDDEGLVMRAPLECPSDRTQSDEEELWMGPWNSRHIPMTKL